MQPFRMEANDTLVAASYFITQVQTIISRNVDPIEGAVVTPLVRSMLARPTMSSQKGLLHGNHSDSDSGDEPLNSRSAYGK